MINTLRITSVLAAIAAGVLIYYFLIPMVVGAEGDERIEKIVGSPTVAEKFKETKGANKKSTGGDPPLVQQANAFARYLSPPKKSTTTGFTRGPKTDRVSVIGPTTPKFKVFATTYFEGNPQLSQALIDEPGKGRHWVRQSSMVGHLLIEQVKDGVVVVKSSKDTYKLEIESNSQAAPMKRTSPTSKSITGRSPPRRSSPTYNRSTSGSSQTASRPSRPSPQTTSSELSAREKAKDDLVKRLEILQKSSSATDKARIAQLISTFGSKMTGSEAEEVKSTAKDPNHASSTIKGGKIDTGSAKPDDKTQK